MSNLDSIKCIKRVEIRLVYFKCMFKLFSTCSYYSHIILFQITSIYTTFYPFFLSFTISFSILSQVPHSLFTVFHFPVLWFLYLLVSLFTGFSIYWFLYLQVSLFTVFSIYLFTAFSSRSSSTSFPRSAAASPLRRR